MTHGSCAAMNSSSRGAHRWLGHSRPPVRCGRRGRAADQGVAHLEADEQVLLARADAFLCKLDLPVAPGLQGGGEGESDYTTRVAADRSGSPVLRRYASSVRSRVVSDARTHRLMAAISLDIDVFPPRDLRRQHAIVAGMRRRSSDEWRRFSPGRTSQCCQVRMACQCARRTPCRHCV
jgi:hypothetical protein